jgi:valyl-tRNA synthetase
MDSRGQLLDRARELRWHPPYMQARLENWINGLNSDWCVSRQRFFGVPFPVWYRLREDGSVDHEARVLPREDRLPIDPSTDVPDGFRPEQRDQPGGFTGDPDVLDTWATSSLTPQIAGRWEEDSDLFARVFPMDVRPQAHDIIRTWLFATVLRAELEHGSLPWLNAAISGWVLDPDRKKMSKSKGNVVTPMGLLEEHGSDGVRYWAASGRPGTDTAFDPAQMKVGRRLAIKFLNASKFVLSRPAEIGPVTHPIDRGLLTALRGLVEDATRALEGYDYARALQLSETFFWSLCDNYLEMVKSRRYGDHGPEAAGSANATLLCALSVLNRLFAPYLPFAAEEVWSWWQPGSVHRAAWPRTGEIDQVSPADAESQRALDAAIEVLGEVRRVKSVEKRPLKAKIDVAQISWTADAIRLIREAEVDLRTAAGIDRFEYAEGVERLSLALTFAPEDAPQGAPRA